MERLVTFLFILFAIPCFAADPDTHTADSCSAAHVAAAITAAADGDTVQIPNCACGDAVWNGTVTVNKDLTIQGNGVGSTCIQSGTFKITTGGSGTTITALKMQKVSNTYPKAIEITSGTTTGGTPITGWRITAMTFDKYGQDGIYIYNGSTGLIDNVLFDNIGDLASDDGSPLISVYGRDDTDWAAATEFGSANRMVIIEDCKFTWTNTDSTAGHVVYTGWGGSTTFRCNHVYESGAGFGADVVDAHGYGHGTGRRGTKIYEVYGNKFEQKNWNSRNIFMRSGTGRVFANRWTNANNYIGLTDYRLWAAYGYAYPTDTNDCSTNGATCAANGTCCQDHEGYPCCDQIGRGTDGEGTRQGSYPYYFWDNKTTGGTDISVTVQDGLSPTYIQENREFFVNQIPTGYTPLRYPHIDRGLDETYTCLSDGNSQAKTGYTFFENDTTAPVLSNLLPSGNTTYATTKQLSVTTTEATGASTCRYHASSTTWAEMTEMSSTGGSTHTQTVNVSVGANTFKVVCRDASANESTAGTWSFTVAAEAASAKSITIGSGSQTITIGGGSQTIILQ